MKTAQEYTESKEYLPDLLKDFHDQKDLFKAIEELYHKSESYKQLNPNWRECHIYTIDFFLWFLGQHGYKIQKVKSKRYAFFDIKRTIKEMQTRRLERLKNSIKW